MPGDTTSGYGFSRPENPDLDPQDERPQRGEEVSPLPPGSLHSSASLNSQVFPDPLEENEKNGKLSIEPYYDKNPSRRRSSIGFQGTKTARADTHSRTMAGQDITLDLYHHPAKRKDPRGRYRHGFGVYSLGMLLLEI